MIDLPSIKINANFITGLFYIITILKKKITKIKKKRLQNIL